MIGALRPCNINQLPWPIHLLQPWMEHKGMALVLAHWHIMALGCAASLLCSCFGYYFGPRIFQSSFCKGKPTMRLNFGHQLSSLLHALITSTISIYNVTNDKLPKDKVFGYSESAAMQCALTAGYFLWDFFSTGMNFSYYGPAFMLHAIIGLFPLTCALSPVLLGYVPGFLLFEISSIFLTGHWFIEKLQLGKRLLLVNDVLLVVLFFLCRIVLGWKLMVDIFNDITAHRASLGTHFYAFMCFTLASTLCLNHFWFYKLFKAFLRHVQGKHVVHRDHHHHHGRMHTHMHQLLTMQSIKKKM